MRLAALARIVLAGALACLLSACWASEKPLLTDRTASAVGFVGKYQGDGDEGPEEADLVATGRSSYELTNGKDEPVRARFLALRGDWYLMQIEVGSDAQGQVSGYAYEPVRLVGGDLHFYGPDCADVPGKFKGLKRDDKDAIVPACNFSRLDGLKAMALAYVAKVEKGEIKDEPNVLERVGP